MLETQIRGIMERGSRVLQMQPWKNPMRVTTAVEGSDWSKAAASGRESYTRGPKFLVRVGDGIACTPSR